MDSILGEVLKHYVELLSELEAFVREIKESDAILRSLLCPKGCVVIAFLIFGIVFSLFAIKVKRAALGLVLIIAVYSFLKYFNEYTDPWFAPFDKLIRDRLPSELEVIFGDQKHHAIGFLCASILIVLLIEYVNGLVHLGILLISILVGYRLYMRYLKDTIKCDNTALVLIGVTIAVLVIERFFYWICDLILILFFAMLGNTILLVYTSVFFNRPAEYIALLQNIFNHFLVEGGSLADLKQYPDIVFLIIPLPLSFMVQKSLAVE